MKKCFDPEYIYGFANKISAVKILDQFYRSEIRVEKNASNLV
jgi:hypothetical protein